MKFVLVLAGSLGTFLALRALSNRLATHQAVLPRVTNKVNTRVTRVNQH